MKRYLLGTICAALLAPFVPAQTISPVVVEYPEKADGKFQVYNDSDLPLTVTVEPHSFTVDSAGKATFRKLDPEIHVSLSSTSFKVAPKQTYYVFYKATTEIYPNWFCIYATVSGPTPPNGLKLALELPHTVYMTGHKTLEPADVAWNRAETAMNGEKRQITAEIENQGHEITRVQEVEVSSGSAKQTFSGFPLFPGQKREIDLDWTEPGVPQQIVLKFPHFKTESAIKELAASK
jgi:hypothetical protein